MTASGSRWGVVRLSRENSVHAAYPRKTFPLKPAIAEAGRGMAHDEPELRRKSKGGGTSSGLQKEAQKLQFSLTCVIKNVTVISPVNVSTWLMF